MLRFLTLIVAIMIYIWSAVQMVKGMEEFKADDNEVTRKKRWNSFFYNTVAGVYVFFFLQPIIKVDGVTFMLNALIAWGVTTGVWEFFEGKKWTFVISKVVSIVLLWACYFEVARTYLPWIVLPLFLVYVVIFYWKEMPTWMMVTIIVGSIIVFLVKKFTIAWWILMTGLPVLMIAGCVYCFFKSTLSKKWIVVIALLCVAMIIFYCIPGWKTYLV